MISLPLLVAMVFLSPFVEAFPAYQSPAAFSDAQVALFIRKHKYVGAQPSPGPLQNTSTKLVNDEDHPYMMPGPKDIRGPCPGLNTLASHGYLPRDGIATPQQIVNAVQEGFNMENRLAIFITWGAFLVDGNPITNLMSIGRKTEETGPNPPAPAIVGGLNTHGLFEGDASTTRGDSYFGDNFSFNETLFQDFINASLTYGGGFYNEQAAAELRWIRIQDSIARNPAFTLLSPRPASAFGESVFPYRFFVDGRLNSSNLDLEAARGFFQHGRFPDGFHRREGAFGYGKPGISDDVKALFKAHPIFPGHNEGAGNYVLNPEDPGLAGGGCFIYTKHVNDTVRGLYPDPPGSLRKALRAGIATFYNAVAGPTCPELFPYGVDDQMDPHSSLVHC